MKLDWTPSFKRLHKTYFAILAACLAAVILALSPDRDSVYRTAIDDLSFLSDLDQATSVRNLIKEELDPTIGKRIYEEAQPLFECYPISIDEKRFLQEIGLSYYLIEPFFDRPMQDVLLLIRHSVSTHYEVMIPKSDEIKKQLSARKNEICPDDSETTTRSSRQLRGVEFSCEERGACKFLVRIGENTFQPPTDTIELAVRGEVHKTGILLTTTVYGEGSPWRDYRSVGLKSVGAEIYGLDPDAAKERLAQLIRSTPEEELVVFGVSVKGFVAFVLTPLAILITVLFMVSGLLELRRLDPPSEQIEMQFVWPLFRNALGRCLSAISLGVLPVGATLMLVIRAVRLDSDDEITQPTHWPLIGAAVQTLCVVTASSGVLYLINRNFVIGRSSSNSSDERETGGGGMQREELHEYGLVGSERRSYDLAVLILVGSDDSLRRRPEYFHQILSDPMYR